MRVEADFNLPLALAVLKCDGKEARVVQLLSLGLMRDLAKLNFGQPDLLVVGHLHHHSLVIVCQREGGRSGHPYRRIHDLVPAYLKLLHRFRQTTERHPLKRQQDIPALFVHPNCYLSLVHGQSVPDGLRSDQLCIILHLPTDHIGRIIDIDAKTISHSRPLSGVLLAHRNLHVGNPATVRLDQGISPLLRLFRILRRLNVKIGVLLHPEVKVFGRLVNLVHLRLVVFLCRAQLRSVAELHR